MRFFARGVDIDLYVYIHGIPKTYLQSQVSHFISAPQVPPPRTGEQLLTSFYSGTFHSQKIKTLPI